MVGISEDGAAVQGARLSRAPWHLWVVGGVSLLWNAFGANDYFQTQTGNLGYFETMMTGMGVTAVEALAYFKAFPAWVHGFWALGVWGALLGSLLLLLRRRHAVWAFVASIAGLAATTFYQLVTPQPEWVDQSSTMSTVIWSVATFLLIYAVSIKNKGALR